MAGDRESQKVMERKTENSVISVLDPPQFTTFRPNGGQLRGARAVVQLRVVRQLLVWVPMVGAPVYEDFVAQVALP